MNMHKKAWRILAALCALALPVVWAAPACAQAAEVKEKPPLYTYVGNWAIPRAQWADMEKNTAATQKILEKALASGTLVGYGNDMNLVHTADGETHDEWWSATSMAGLLNTLEQIYQAGNPTSPVLASATKHWDNIFVSRFYNWHPGSWKDIYTYGAIYKLKPDAPDDALETLSKNFIVPLMEKMLSAGTIHEYEVDTEAVHTDAPGTFTIVYVAANAESLDKVRAALRDTLKANPLLGPAFDSLLDQSAHRDELLRSLFATYK